MTNLLSILGGGGRILMAGVRKRTCCYERKLHKLGVRLAGGVSYGRQAVIRMLLALKAQHGDLNTALVREYVLLVGTMSERSLAQDLGVSRSVVRRALQGWSEMDRY